MLFLKEVLKWIGHVVVMSSSYGDIEHECWLNPSVDARDSE
jgi:hypothetical protein